MERMPQPGDIYQHFKGNLYRVVTMAKHSETGEELVVYQALYGGFEVYARPLALFMGKVDAARYPQSAGQDRFVLIPLASGPVMAQGFDGAADRAVPQSSDGAADRAVPQSSDGAANQAVLQATDGAANQAVPQAADGGQQDLAAQRPGEAVLPAAGQQEKRAQSGEEEAFVLDPLLASFLDAESYEEKLEVFRAMRGRADADMLNTVAVSLDLELPGGTLEEQYEMLKNCLLTLERYECNRLR